MGQFMCKLWKTKDVRVLMLGLDAAGKTTIMYTLKLGEVVTTIPTIGFNVETIKDKKLGLNFTAWDVGGRGKIRPLMRHYFPNTDAVIYIVDSNDKERLDEAVEEFESFLKEDELKDSVFMILCNKQDLPNCLPAQHIKDTILANQHTREIGVFPVCGLKRNSLKEPLEWLTQQLAKRETWNLAKVSAAEAQEIVKPVTSPISYFKQSYSYFKSLFVAS